MALRFSPTRGAASLVLNSLVRGPQGTAATLAVGTTTTLAAGASATVGNSGSTSAAVFDLGIPRGADAGLRYAFESSTAMAAPASGGIRANNATLTSATAFAVNATNSDAVDVSDWIATWDDSTNTSKGTFLVRKEGSGAVEYIFTVTSIVDNGAWLQINGAFVSGSGALSAADKVYLTPSITGNVGAMVGPGASVDSEVALFSGTGGATLKRATGSGLAKLTSGVLSVAAAGTDYYNPGGTDVAVADGGTGSSTASGAATNLGLGTGDSPQFTAVNIGNATDTTLTRVSAGIAAIEGATIPGLSVANTWTAVQGYAPATLTFNASQTWDVSVNPIATLAMTANITSFSISNAVAGRYYTLKVTQDASARTIAYTAANFKFVGGSAPVLSTGSGAIDYYTFIALSATVLHEVGRSQAVA